MENPLHRLSAAITLALFFNCDSTGVGNPPADGSLVLAESEQLLIADGDENRKAGDTASALTSLPLLSLLSQSDIADSTTAASLSAMRAGRWFRAECVSVTSSANRVSYQFLGCARGPFDLAKLQGTLTVTFQDKGANETGPMNVILQSDGLTLDDRAAQYGAQATISFENGMRKTTWQGDFASINDAGVAFSHKADLQFTYDGATGCLGINGTSGTTLNDRGISVLWENYTRCGPRTRCPQQGSVLTLTRIASDPALSLRIDYVGGQRANVVLPTQESPVLLPLTCEK